MNSITTPLLRTLRGEIDPADSKDDNESVDFQKRNFSKNSNARPCAVLGQNWVAHAAASVWGGTAPPSPHYRGGLDSLGVTPPKKGRIAQG